MIFKTQEVNTINDLDCGKVNDSQLERLGEAWMSLMHPDSEVHERMDQMMARLPAPKRSDGGQEGEGSEALQAAHISMGQRYLGCSNLYERGWSGFMGMVPLGGMMSGWSELGVWNMSLFWLLWLVTWILGNALLVALIRYFWKKVK